MSGVISMTNHSRTQEDHIFWCEDHQEGVILWACSCVVGFVFGFPAAVSVLWDLMQRVRKGVQLTPYDVFVFNATVIDGSYLLFSLAEVYNNLQGHDRGFHGFMTFFFPFNLCGRPLFTACICVDCYLAVVHPVFYHSNKSLTPRILTAVGVWTLTLIYGCLYLQYAGFIDDLIVVMVFALVLPVTEFCNISIFWTLKRSNPAGGSVHPKKKRALQVIINNQVISVTSFLPPIIGVLAAKILNTHPIVTYCYVMFPVMSSMVIGNSVSPILYLNNLGKLDWLKRQK